MADGGKRRGVLQEHRVRLPGQESDSNESDSEEMAMSPVDTYGRPLAPARLPQQDGAASGSHFSMYGFLKKLLNSYALLNTEGDSASDARKDLLDDAHEQAPLAPPGLAGLVDKAVAGENMVFAILRAISSTELPTPALQADKERVLERLRRHIFGRAGRIVFSGDSPMERYWALINLMRQLAGVPSVAEGILQVTEKFVEVVGLGDGGSTDYTRLAREIHAGGGVSADALANIRPLADEYTDSTRHTCTLELLLELIRVMGTFTPEQHAFVRSSMLRRKRS